MKDLWKKELKKCLIEIFKFIQLFVFYCQIVKKEKPVSPSLSLGLLWEMKNWCHDSEAWRIWKFQFNCLRRHRYYT